MRFEAITDVFFDLDHTLWDFDRNSALAFEKVFRELQIPIQTETFIAIYHPINQACWKLYQVDKITHEELRYKRLRDSFDGLNYTISDEIINRIAVDYITYLPENNILFEGAIDVLDYLKSKYTLHVITNGFAEVQYKKLKNSGIDSYFSTVTNSEKAGVKKPHPYIYDYALKQAETEKERSVMIGDCIDADVRGAIAFGMSAVFFNPRGEAVPEGISVVTHLNEIKSLL